MSFGEDEEILQDFLVEAGEILEQLSEQLVELERRPGDRDLLNAIFRGFHTVKGGAGFLQLNALVDCCHITENLFDKLRNGERSVSPELMDVVLQALDTVNAMFAAVQSGEQPDPADPALLASLEALVNGSPLAGAADAQPAAMEPAQEPPAEPVIGDLSDAEFEQFLDALDDDAPPASALGGADTITEDEFEALLDQIHGKGKSVTKPITTSAANTPPAADSAGSDTISDDEFEALLDQLHGGSAPGRAEAAASAAPANQAPPQPTARQASPATGSPSTGVPAGPTDDVIADDEFEALLDQLHGKGKAPAARSSTPAAATAAPPAAPSVPPRRSAADAQQAAAREPSAETTVRVDTQRLDDIMNMVGELVLVRNRLVRLGLNSGDDAMTKAVSNLDVVTADLQSAVMKTRMQPIKKVFGRFPRVVRDLARTLKKEISLELQGEDTDLDKNLVEALADPLVHLVRNAVDHGIEMPEVRERAGKPRLGRVVLAAAQEGDHILLSIADDGGGMDPAVLRAKAVEKGLYDADAAARLSDTEAFNLIFAPGFSTKVEVSDVSGRGVGMDVVKTKIAQLNGSIEIQSRLGEGTRLAIKVPLTLAIMPTLMVMLGEQTFAFPLVSVNEIFHMDLRRTHVVDGQEVITVRDKALPLFYLKRWLVPRAGDERDAEFAHVVIVTVGTRRIGFVVDQLIGQEEVVIKPLGKMLHGTPGMSGATITGDGRIALILDVPSLLKRYAGRM